ncbi:MAG: L-threonylcarbamoyladenylate synthase, partial [Acidobacteriota bacterium]
MGKGTGRVETLRLKVDVGNPGSEASRQALARAAEILRGGGTVAFPTETVYGLGANALDAEAVKKIFVAKERPSWDPLIVHAGDRAMLARVAAEVSAEAERLVEAFWPGPLTLLLPRSAEVPALVTAGLERVGVRMPAHPVTQALLQAARIPVAAP